MERRRLGRYVLDAQLGMGGMGVVHAATDTHLGRQVALKVVSGQFASAPAFRERFQREAATLARLDSPHVIAIFDHGEQDGVTWLAMQYVRGGDLGRLLATRGALPPAAAVAICMQLAEALADAHRVGVVHRDIKPSNVLVRDPDAARLHVYLCDFGIALDANADRLTSAGGVVGTWSYLAPERSQGRPATPASDVYSLGCLLWMCLTGKAPYVGNDVAVAMAHVSAPVRQLAGSDPRSLALNEVLSRSMAKDPARRYGSAEELHRDLGRVPPTGEPVTERPLPPTSPPPSSSPPPSGPPPLPPLTSPRSPGRSPRPIPHEQPPLHPPAGPTRSRGVVVGVVTAVLALLVGVVSIVVVATSGDGGGRAGTDPSTDEESSTETPGPVTNDLTGDGLGDVSAYYDDGVEVADLTYTSTGTGFDVSRAASPSGYPAYLDVDDDGGLDRVEATATDDGELRVASSSEGLDGTVYPGVVLTPRERYVYPLTGDFTGDGEPDLLVWGQTGQLRVTVWVLEGRGPDRFADPEVWASIDDHHVDTTFLRVGDVDGDGSTDLLAQLPTGTPTLTPTGADWRAGRGVQVYRSTGSEFIREGPFNARVELQTASLAVGDFAGEGRAFLAVSAAEATTIPVYEFVDGEMTALPDFEVTLAAESVATTAVRPMVSDVDGDGDDDLVLTNPEPDQADVSVAVSEDGGFAAPVPWALLPPCQEAKKDCVFAWNQST